MRGHNKWFKEGLENYPWIIKTTYFSFHFKIMLSKQINQFLSLANSYSMKE